MPDICCNRSIFVLQEMLPCSRRIPQKIRKKTDINRTSKLCGSGGRPLFYVLFFSTATAIAFQFRESLFVRKLTVFLLYSQPQRKRTEADAAAVVAPRDCERRKANCRKYDPILNVVPPDSLSLSLSLSLCSFGKSLNLQPAFFAPPPPFTLDDHVFFL
jgi:hypothetical protein